jgi:hypothetical protein
MKIESAYICAKWHNLRRKDMEAWQLARELTRICGFSNYLKKYEECKVANREP